MRTSGLTTDCRGCRFWSEMIAKAEGLGPIEALCLNEASPAHSKYTRATFTCDGWRSGHHGAVDDPPDYGESARALYAEEDGS